VIALHVDDNDHVKAGDVLLEIDPADYQAKVDQAAAAVAAAEECGRTGKGRGVARRSRRGRGAGGGAGGGNRSETPRLRPPPVLG